MPTSGPDSSPGSGPETPSDNGSEDNPETDEEEEEEETCNDRNVPLYRSVEPVELQDLQATNQFNPGSFAFVKQFWPNLTNARDFCVREQARSGIQETIVVGGTCPEVIARSEILPVADVPNGIICLLYTSPSPRD